MKELLELSKVLKELRLKYKYTQRQVAQKLDVSYQSYQAYELGISLPSLQNFVKLSKLYDVSLDFLVGNSHY